MDILDKDIFEVWSFSNKNQVKYIVVGDYASHIHEVQGLARLWIYEFLIH